ncbi:MAG: DUF898 domain-containing protein, partial [Methylobacteriaceae bacterium]|nr:DUF898 domain-containing protein [Methylobacteriaceae bacterium]
MLGYSLEYHATPQQILIGRLIIVGWLVLLVILWTIDRRLGILAALSAVFFVPWMISRGLKFAARHTSWRNVRFRFAGGGGGAFVAGFIQMLVTSFPWIQPLAWHRANHYLYDSLSWGPVCFKVHATVGKVFRVGLVSLAWMVGLLIGVLVVAFALTVLGMVFALIPKDGGQSEPLVMFISNVTIFIGAVIIVVNLACYRIRVFNAIRSSLTATWEPEKWIAGADYAAMHRRGAPAPGAVVAMVNSRMSPRHWVWIWTS